MFGWTASEALQAQFLSDALLFSDMQPGATARSLAVGNALGALGGDAGCMGVNPAGLAIYRNSEVLFSPSVSFGGTRTSFADSVQRMNRAAANIGNISLILAGPVQNEIWKGVSIGVSYNRTASFNRSFRMDGTTYGSRLVAWADNAQGFMPSELNPFEERPAYDAYLIDNPGGGSNYISALTDSNYVRKIHNVRQVGGMHQLNIGLGGNVKNRFYIGANIGVPFLSLRDTRTYEEIEETDAISFKEMRFEENRRVRGSGINIGLGIIYRVLPILRVGLAFKSPTVLQSMETYYTTLYGKVIYFDTMRVHTFDSPDGRYPFRQTTPLVLTGSLGLLLGKKGKPKIGFLGIEADFINYRAARFGLRNEHPFNDPSNQSYMDLLNRQVQDLLQPAFRLRAGAEFVLKNWRLRLGYQMRSSPYAEPVEGVSDLRHDISMGLGIRSRVWFFDLTYCHTLYDFEHLPYRSATLLQRATVKASGGTIQLAVGVRFGERLDS